MFFLMIRREPRSTHFPYTTIFRSQETPPVLEEVAPQDKSPLEVLAPKVSLLGMLLQKSRGSTLDELKQPRPPVSSQGLGIFSWVVTQAMVQWLSNQMQEDKLHFRLLTMV